MANNSILCTIISDKVKCKQCCSFEVIKNGRTKNRKQQYVCKNCKYHFIDNYTYNACKNGTNDNIAILTKEGLGIRSIARVLKISITTVLKRIVSIAIHCNPPAMKFGKAYEIDELRSFIKEKDKLIWIVYALERETKKVVSFNVGRRTNKTLSVVTNNVILSSPKSISTDKLINYKSLIDKNLHQTTRFGTNHIERKNLTLRTHLKRLNRRTICFSRSLTILKSVLKIYFWY
ncbi:IS1 family transposase [Flavobacterium sp.]|uniref:IS1 family transposase n=1 Tax=Flavobacterium sp. TaxID=239 RepID=UPI0028BD24BA|nr:IS1 family transposase [Flavobacterium sp.]